MYASPFFSVQQYIKSWFLQIFLEYLQEISISSLNLKQLAEAIVHINNTRTVQVVVVKICIYCLCHLFKYIYSVMSS